MPDQNKMTRIGVIGLGGRGKGLLRTLLKMDDIEIPALCEVYEERLNEAQEQVVEADHPEPDIYTHYSELLDRDDIDGVVVASSWITHIEIAIAAMEAGIYPGLEVGGASSIQECWDLVKTSEKTGIPCMMLENCCYGRKEMALLNMINRGMFGELIHCQCGYQHDLQKMFVMGKENKHFRIDHLIHRNADLYPTHGLGPVAKFLNINRGNRFLTLTSMSSKARGLHDWAEEKLGENHSMTQKDFLKGDIVTTMIKCAHGETILIVHDTSLPRPYSRGGRVQGTKGLWMEDNNSIYVKGESPEHKWESFDSYLEKYDHPLWKEFQERGVRGGHGGNDYLTLRAFVESIKNENQVPIDVYDTASWMAVTALSEDSIARGSTSVAFPDFTNGKWIKRKPEPENKFALNDIHEHLF